MASEQVHHYHDLSVPQSRTGKKLIHCAGPTENATGTLPMEH